MEDLDMTQNPYANEAQQRWPDNFAQSQQRMAKLTLQEQRAIFAQHGEIAVSLTALMLAGVSPTESAVQEQIGNHYRWICNFWTPDLAAYVALGQMYVDDERFAATYNAFGDGLAEFIRRGILHYAASNLA
ncbi:MAG: TipAS antibiotic-recognition domain-containing protein [Micrococcales bacterium]